MNKKELLDVFKNCDFSGQIHDDNFEKKIIDNLHPDFECEYCFGASKICIIPDYADYVIKIPFTSTWNSRLQDYYNFENATIDSRYEWDYCLAETLIYQYAKRENIHKMFCKERILGYVNNYPIYIQKRATMYHEVNGDNHVDFRALDIIKYCANKNFPCFNTIWIADALEYYGQSMFNRMMHFIKLHGIRDLHAGNLGYLELKPVLVDFSGFSEDC